MSLLTLIQNASKELSLDSPSTVIGNSDLIVTQLLQLLYRVSREARDQVKFTELEKEHTFTLATSTASYALPADFDRIVSTTMWDRTDQDRLLGAVNPQRWQVYNSGVTSVTPYDVFRIKGTTDTQFFIYPTPTATNNGNTQVFEYVSNNWISPANWANGTTYSASAYVNDDGVIYQTTAGGTSSGTGVADDSGVTDWAEVTSYPSFVADTDYCRISEDFLGLGVQWRFMMMKGLAPWQELRAEWYQQLRREATKKRAGKRLPLAHTGRNKFIGSSNLPDSGYLP